MVLHGFGGRKGSGGGEGQKKVLGGMKSKEMKSEIKGVNIANFIGITL